jgi:hypothetical protein
MYRTRHYDPQFVYFKPNFEGQKRFSSGTFFIKFSSFVYSLYSRAGYDGARMLMKQVT